MAGAKYSCNLSSFPDKKIFSKKKLLTNRLDSLRYLNTLIPRNRFFVVQECRFLTFSDVMPTPQNRPFSPDSVLAGKLQRLIFGRFVTVFALLAVHLWWTNESELGSEVIPRPLLYFFLFSIGLTGAYYLAFRTSLDHLGQTRVQVFFDAFLVTWLVWATGDVTSPYIPLYIILVSVTGIMLGKNETLSVAILSAACFTVISLLTAQAMIHSASGNVSMSGAAQVIARNVIAILVVGLLAARLAERRSISEELRQTEESFADLHILHERIVESISTGLITTDLNGRIYAFNRAAEEISGLRAAAMLGRSVYSLFGKEMRTPVGLRLGSVQIGDFRPAHFEANIGAGKPVTVACSVSPLVGKTGQVSGLIITFQDVTRIRAMEETLRRSDRLAAVGRMAAGLAHEIRNPLGSMSSALQFLQVKVPPATPESNLMNVMLRESERLNEIITNFLAYARPQSDGFSPVTRDGRTDVAEAIRDCIALLRHSPEVKETHLLEADLPGNPVKISTNETQIKQVCWNLLQNSIQAMPDGGSVSIRLKELPGRHVQIVFQDTGTGISPDNMEHLFEPFSNAARGTGLGLSIVHKIISDNGGRIDVQSAHGEGTKITVELPH